MNIETSPVGLEDLPQISALTEEANEAQVIPLLPEEGRENLRSFRDKKLRRMLDPDTHPAIKATLDGQVVGYVTWRDGNFVTALYVSLAHQRLGIGQRLMDAMIERITLPEVKLRASINAVGFYHRYGFQAQAEEQLLHGIRFVPMVLEVRHTKHTPTI